MKWIPVSEPPKRRVGSDSAYVDCIVWLVDEPEDSVPGHLSYDTVNEEWGDLFVDPETGECLLWDVVPTSQISHYIRIDEIDGPTNDN